jgi:predicted alpha/beta hydrolase
VGLWGISIGGHYAGLVASGDARLAAAVLAVPGVAVNYSITERISGAAFVKRCADSVQRNVVNARTSHWLVAVAIAALILGAILSRVIEPGVRVEKIMLTTNTPAIRLFRATPGPHPKALLAHGGGGSKEMLFRFGEALAAAGFDCYSVDQAGQGESPAPIALTNLVLAFPELERALGGVDVFIGHSLGGGAAAWSVRE